MFVLYSSVRVKSSGFTGSIVEIDDNNGKNLPVYLVEYDEQFYDDPNDALDWFEEDEIELVK